MGFARDDKPAYCFAKVVNSSLGLKFCSAHQHLSDFFCLCHGWILGFAVIKTQCCKMGRQWYWL